MSRLTALWYGLGVGVMTAAAAQAAQGTPHASTLVADASVGVIIKMAPPPPRREVIVERERPSREHVWINGYWVWREGRHVWIAGRWERPPHPNAVWVEPRWEHRREGYVFIDGFWR